ncbi:MAG TPA: hypothetical protein VFB34_11970 [Chloroflexota bacterium]|nr:hypothetical protein [Chloroflexota bacterium]
MAIDKVVIEGAEFTRVSERYLLQSEVERVLEARHVPTARHVERLTTLLEDIVSTADAVALEVVEAQARRSEALEAERSARTVLVSVREGLREQMLSIDTYMQRIEG